MYMKSLVSLAVLGAMSAVATAGDPVVFDNPNESYTVDGLNIFGATINASDITITNTAPASNGITAYGDFKLNAANDISIQGTQNGIFTPDDHANPSITIKTPKKLTITGPWAIHAEGEGKITIDAGDLVLRGSNGIAANSTGTVSIDAQTVDIACTNKYGVSSANTGGVTIKAEKSIYIKGGSANAVNGLQGAIKLESNGTTVVDGDILARAATVSADFKGAGSSLTGAVTTGDTGTTKLGFSDGALWKAEGDSKVSELTLKGGVVDLNNHNVTAKQLAENSAATIRLDAGAETLGSFTVGNQDVKADLNVDLVQNADVVDEALAKQALAQIQTGDNTTVEAHVKEGLVNPDITFNKDGSTASVGTNTLIRDTLDLAAASSLSLNRILMQASQRASPARTTAAKSGCAPPPFMNSWATGKSSPERATTPTRSSRTARTPGSNTASAPTSTCPNPPTSGPTSNARPAASSIRNGAPPSAFATASDDPSDLRRKSFA